MALRSVSQEDHLQVQQFSEVFRDLSLEIIDGALDLRAVSERVGILSPNLVSDFREETFAQCVEMASKPLPDLFHVLRDDFAKLKLLKAEFEQNQAEMNLSTLLLKENNDRAEEMLEKDQKKKQFMEEILFGAQQELENDDIDDDTRELQNAYERLKLFLDELMEEHCGEFKKDIKEIAAAVYKKRNETDKYWEIPEHIRPEAVLILLDAGIIETQDNDFNFVKQSII